VTMVNDGTSEHGKLNDNTQCFNNT